MFIIFIFETINNLNLFIMKKFEYKIGSRDVTIIFGTQEELSEFTDKINEPDINTVSIGNTHYIQEEEDEAAMICKAMRALFNVEMNEALGKAESGEIMSDEETDRISYDLTKVLYKMAEEI